MADACSRSPVDNPDHEDELDTDTLSAHHILALQDSSPRADLTLAFPLEAVKTDRAYEQVIAIRQTKSHNDARRLPIDHRARRFLKDRDLLSISSKRLITYDGYRIVVIVVSLNAHSTSVKSNGGRADS